MACGQASPSPRVGQFTASTRDTLYLWGGRGDKEPEAVFVYSVNTETWTKKLSKSPPPPPGLGDGGCSIAGQHLYLYGGHVGSSYSGSLYQLNTDTWTWRELCNGSSDGGPGKKTWCCMITYQDQLWVVGGSYGLDKTPEIMQPGASYERGLTNEVHLYDTKTGETVARSGETVARSGETEARSGETVARSGETVARSGETVARSGENVARSGEAVARSGETVARSGETVARSGETEARSGETVARSGEAVARSGEAVARSGETVARFRWGCSTVS